MLEKDIENLIALYPERFFPDQGFTLVGQQVSLGKCRVDLIFKDKHKRAIIIEVKRGILGREAAGQIIEYYGLLKQENSNEIVELILCANTIPAERKMFLERVGIECKEVGVALIANLARECNYRFLDEPAIEEKQSSPKQQLITKSKVDLFSGGNVWIFQANPNRFDILNALADPHLKLQKWQVNQYKDEVKKGDIALLWMSGKESGIYAVTEVISDPQMMPDFPEEEKYWMNEADKGVKTLKVNIEIKNDMTNAPLFRKKIKTIPELKNLSILKFFQGTNFPVTQEEWSVIKDKINET